MNRIRDWWATQTLRDRRWAAALLCVVALAGAQQYALATQHGAGGGSGAVVNECPRGEPPNPKG
jgi:hypothetical protein